MRHSLEGNAKTREVLLDGDYLMPNKSQAVINHSPDGFSWGYNGSGPAQLALAIILELTGTPGKHQNFKSRVIATLPFGKDFDIELKLTPYSQAELFEYTKRLRMVKENLEKMILKK